MGTDFSRVRLNPLLDFAGVELKQGGLLLDADANELVEIIDRRLRALASDVLGRATVSATTVDAFKIAVAGAGLTAGSGSFPLQGWPSARGSAAASARCSAGGSPCSPWPFPGWSSRSWSAGCHCRIAVPPTSRATCIR